MSNNRSSTQGLSGRLSNCAPDIMRVASVLIWRAIQTLVILPAAMVGLFLAVGVLTNSVATQDIVQGFYDHADQSRNARPGFVSFRECTDPSSVDPVTRSNKYKAPLLCQSWKLVEVPTVDAVSDAVAVIHRIYGILVIVSFGTLFVFYPGLLFVGLSHRSR